MKKDYFIVLIYRSEIKCNGILATVNSAIVPYDCSANFETEADATKIRTTKVRQLDHFVKTVKDIKMIPRQESITPAENLAVAFVSSSR